MFWDLEPALAVRVVSDGPDWAAVLIPVAASLVGVWLGGWVTLRGSRKAERERFAEETKHLARSIAAEIRAGLAMLDRMEGIMKSRDQAFRLDTLKYTDVPENPMPITRAASEKVGRFTPRVAIGIATLLVRMSNMRQAAMTMRAMHAANDLPEAKLHERIQVTAPLAKDVKDAGRDLAKAIDDDYGSE